jgi:two-component system, LuxR family, sensor kinase FixL
MELSRKRRPDRSAIQLQHARPEPCVIGLDAAGCVRGWTKAAEAMFGHARDRALGMPFEQLAPVVAEGGRELEGWCRRVDGSVFRGLIGVLAAHETVFAAPGVTQTIVVTDVTSHYVREQAQARAQADALKLSEAKLQAILAATSDGVVLIDTSGFVVSLNGVALAMLRGTNRSFLHVPWYSALGLPKRPLPASGTFELTSRHADGSPMTLECQVRELATAEMRMSMIVMHDVTHQRLLDRQVFDVSEQLRRQIGQDLHDGLGQLLTGTAFLTKGLQHSLSAEHQSQVQRIVELINVAITRVRSLARGLSPIHADAQTLQDVLQHAVGEASELLGVKVELSHSDFAGTAQPAAIAQLCLITREAITNAVRHGRADHIVVRLARQGDRSQLSIEDNGVGIGDLVEGLGVRSMRYRAKVIGGELDVARTPTGTTVRCLWPDM